MSVASEKRWTVQESAQLYEIEQWAGNYFHIASNGNLCVSPDRNSENSIDLKHLVDQLGREASSCQYFSDLTACWPTD